MEIYDRVSTGLSGFDKVIDHLRLGDNVVWQVDSMSDYMAMAGPYLTKAIEDRRNIVYFRFGDHGHLLEDSSEIKTYEIDASKGFENFATHIHNIITKEGKKTFYLFDCLTDLLEYWNSDLMIGNFFKVTCPYLYELDTVAYFAIKRDTHTYTTIAGIRETTQLLIDLYRVEDNLYAHPLKVWQRYSPTMFFPHLIKGQEAICITSSADVAGLFSGIKLSGDRKDHWDITFEKGKESLSLPTGEQSKTKLKLMKMLIGTGPRMFDLCKKYFTLEDILDIASREVGTGLIGGKAVGMLLSRKILEKDAQEIFSAYIEHHDSFYLGADIFYTYIVQNGWWKLRTMQKTPEGYFKYAPELKEKMFHGKFPKDIQEQFIQLLEHFGQSPIIVRSSSLLEDNFGNAFAGKYESVFCANQGSPEDRYAAFEDAIRTVYASTMNEDALAYRMNRGLFENDEQMAILVQRVSGDQYEDFFFPHIAGVGNSSNLYVWDKDIDMSAGMLRMVFGLGTRAVDRAGQDYAKMVCLDDPKRIPPMDHEDLKKYSQHKADILSLSENTLTSRDLDKIFDIDIRTDKELFASVDRVTEDRLRELGYRDHRTPYIYDFRKLLWETKFPATMKNILSVISDVYDHPVDIEFTANFTLDGSFRINLVQCRPLQTRDLGNAVALPDPNVSSDVFFKTEGNFMGGNVRLPVNQVIYVDASAYADLTEQKKYDVAKHIGIINSQMKNMSALLIGPGRWGTTTPSLGVPVSFAQICNMSVICEYSSESAGFMPELSYGSHFFQDLVETGIFYAAIIEESQDVVFDPEIILSRENILLSISPKGEDLLDVIHVARTDGMEVFSDILSQKLICR